MKKGNHHVGLRSQLTKRKLLKKNISNGDHHQIDSNPKMILLDGELSDHCDCKSDSVCNTQT